MVLFVEARHLREGFRRLISAIRNVPCGGRRRRQTKRAKIRTFEVSAFAIAGNLSSLQGKLQAQFNDGFRCAVQSYSDKLCTSDLSMTMSLKDALRRKMWEKSVNPPRGMRPVEREIQILVGQHVGATLRSQRDARHGISLWRKGREFLEKEKFLAAIPHLQRP